MSALTELISQIDDKSLRERIMQETERAMKSKKFGLVFEDHMPELTPIFGAVIRKGSTVSIRDKKIEEIWLVIMVNGEKALCFNQVKHEEKEFALEDLVVVAQFGEPIFPSLRSVERVKNCENDKLWHTLIEADNYHALQLLEYLYPKQVDCIYIDPPYNTGARDWKYNNDYVDSSDNWRHSKWLSMMEKRLNIARRILNPNTGVLIVTIDEHEVHHLRVLLEQLFPGFYIQMVTAVINPKGVTQGRFSRVEEYVIYCFAPNAYVNDSNDNLLNPPVLNRNPRWKGLLRSGTNASRADRKNMFYPVYIDENLHAVVGVGEALPFDVMPVLGEKFNNLAVAWPIRNDGSLGRWGVGYETLQELIGKGYVSCGKYDGKRQTWGLSYISQPNQKLIEAGGIKIVSRDHVTNVVEIEYAQNDNRVIKTVWHRTSHDAGAYGSDLVSKIVGQSRAFSFPKSLYAERDSLNAVLRNNKRALVVDFFAGSGTTLHAVNLLNAEDNGHRRCILITNNEVSEDDSRRLKGLGLQPGTIGWEKHGICQAVTWSRTKYSILGKRDDGTVLEGEYLSNATIEKEQGRSFYQLSFVDKNALQTTKAKKQLVSLLGKNILPQSLIKENSRFIVSEKHAVSILFDDTWIDEWLDALNDQNHITGFYIVTSNTSAFSNAKDKIMELLGSITTIESIKRPMKEGFAANVEYFKLNFLDKSCVELGQQFREILPILWLQAGAVGTRPEISTNDQIPDILAPEGNTFAVLVDESAFFQFANQIEGRSEITHVYLVTNSDEAYREMAAKLKVPNIKQLYRDYIDNFVLNTRREQL